MIRYDKISKATDRPLETLESDRLTKVQDVQD